MKRATGDESRSDPSEEVQAVGTDPYFVQHMLVKVFSTNGWVDVNCSHLHLAWVQEESWIQNAFKCLRPMRIFPASIETEQRSLDKNNKPHHFVLFCMDAAHSALE